MLVKTDHSYQKTEPLWGQVEKYLAEIGKGPKITQETSDCLLSDGNSEEFPQLENKTAVMISDTPLGENHISEPTQVKVTSSDVVLIRQKVDECFLKRDFTLLPTSAKDYLTSMVGPTW